MLSSPLGSQRPRRHSLHLQTTPSPRAAIPSDIYTDARTHGFAGPTRTVRFPKATPNGGGAISKSPDGQRCVVAGRESLRILRMSDTPSSIAPDHKSAVGRGGHRIDCSRNFWVGSGLKIDCVSTDVAWCRETFANKILTSARNGELIMWDLSKSGSSKYERRARDHMRSIHRVVCSPVVPYYCMTGSADGDVRVWDLRDVSNSLIRIHHPTSVRAIAFSPSSANPVQAVVGLDNGCLYRWDLKMGQRGQLDRIPVAHTGHLLDLDWCSATASSGLGRSAGWIASGGLDRTVKIWDLTSAHIAHTPTYTLSTAFPVRRVLWRPSYECELAVVSNAEFGSNSNQDIFGGSQDGSDNAIIEQPKKTEGEEANAQTKVANDAGDAVEIWDVRRGYIAKWAVGGSAVEGGVTDIEFGDSHALWAQHTSGMFSQLDLRYSTRPLDAIPRVSATWEASGSFTFVTDRKPRWEIPFDDMDPDSKQALEGKGKVKGLGDGPFKPTSQHVGTFAYEQTPEDMDAFVIMARGYVYEGADRHSMCGSNAEIAAQVGRPDAAQTWLLMQSLIPPPAPAPSPSPSRPPSPPLSPLPLTSPSLPHSISAPAAIPSISNLHSPPTNPPAIRPSTSDAIAPLHSSIHVQTSPGHSPSRGARQASSASASNSNSPSPRRVSSTNSALALSPGTSTPSTSSRPPSLFPRRQSSASHRARPRGFSIFRRPSISSPSGAPSETTSTSASATNSQTPSLRHVGEGALDDSDSSSGGSGGLDSDDEPVSAPPPTFDLRERSTSTSTSTSSSAGAGSSSGGVLSPAPSPLTPTPGSAISPTSFVFPRPISAAAPHPSPLSRVAMRNVWTEDESSEGRDDDAADEEDDDDDDDDEDDDSPSPASTDSDSAGSHRGSVRLVLGANANGHARAKSNPQVPVPTPARSRRGSVVRAKPHSLGRTGTLMPRELAPQSSRSSIRTVRGEEGHDLEAEREKDGAGAVGPGSVGAGVPKSEYSGTGTRTAEGSPGMKKRVASFGASLTGEGLFSPNSEFHREERSQSVQERRYLEEVQRQEEQAREAAWVALKAALEGYAEDGNLQMCAFMALVAQKELGVNEQRLLRFLEGYIDLLTRLRLHASAAYMRKHAPPADIQDSTNLQTTIYLSCGLCEKPILLHGSSYCQSCKANATKCAICHLPVRKMLFHCAICSHGGHQECYRRYYLERPMVEIPTPPSPPQATVPATHTRGRSLSRGSNGHTALGDEEVKPEKEKEKEKEKDVSGAGNAVNGAQGLGRQLMGHPCATGCGHFCWIGNERTDEE
ncbi:hypothetical protein DENSPDRAFT_449486 [Dentipellis sp. KUC8613]|nr:hypothetical protein DENSPDRAFT_449486 [Dentipellis sp. KUC8613]